jgi:hypothetical protein
MLKPGLIVTEKRFVHIADVVPAAGAGAAPSNAIVTAAASALPIARRLVGVVLMSSSPCRLVPRDAIVQCRSANGDVADPPEF